MSTLQTIRTDAIARLKRNENPSAQLDVDLLLEEVMGMTSLEIILDPKIAVTDIKKVEFEALLERRLAYEPISQILGRKDFWSLTFKVSRDCLTPRPDSETLIDAAIQNVSDKNRPYRILDLGTGSGCLILSLLSELPYSTGLAVDKSDQALSWARTNAIELGMSDRCEFLLSDWDAQIPHSEKFDIILSNPPYITELEKEDLDPDVRHYEPEMALFARDGGREGGCLEYRLLADIIPERLTSGGQAFLEIGHRQGQEVVEIFEKTSAKEVAVIPDLAKRDRCVVVKF